MPDHQHAFLHASDLRIDQQPYGFGEVPQHLKQLLIDASYVAARKVFEAAVFEQVSFVILSGDVIDFTRCGARGISFLMEQFQLLNERGIKVYWSLGKAEQKRFPQHAQWPSNVVIFPNGRISELTHFEEDTPIATILGTSWDGRESLETTGFRSFLSDHFTIVAAYGQLDGPESMLNSLSTAESPGETLQHPGQDHEVEALEEEWIETEDVAAPTGADEEDYELVSEDEEEYVDDFEEESALEDSNEEYEEGYEEVEEDYEDEAEVELDADQHDETYAEDEELVEEVEYPLASETDYYSASDENLPHNYWALGGQRQSQDLKRGRATVHFPGTPQGRCPFETGSHGCSIVSFTPEGVSGRKRVITDALRFSDIQLTAKASDAYDDIERQAVERSETAVTEAGGKPVLTRWSLPARLPANTSPASVCHRLREALQKATGFGSPPGWPIEFLWRAPERLPESWSEEESILGDFVRMLTDYEWPDPVTSFAEAHRNDLLPLVRQAQGEESWDWLSANTAYLGTTMLQSPDGEADKVADSEEHVL